MYTQYYNTIYPTPANHGYQQYPAPYAHGGYPYGGYEQATGQQYPAPVNYDYASHPLAHDPHSAGASAAYRLPSEPSLPTHRPPSEPPLANHYEGDRAAETLAPTESLPAKQTLRRAIESGYRIFTSLSPQAQYELQRRGRKGLSFRKLAAARQMPVSTLWRTLAIYLLFRRYPEIAEYRHLGVGHVSVVLSVHPEHQLYFLRNAEVRGWSRRQLDQEVKLYHTQQDYARHGTFTQQ